MADRDRIEMGVGFILGLLVFWFVSLMIGP